MKLIVKLFGLLMLVVGILLLIYPDFIIGWIETKMQKSLLFIFAIGMRLVIGFIFLAVAKSTRFPLVFKILGCLFIIAAITFIFVGHERFIGFISTIIPNFGPYVRIVSMFVIVFGGFLIYAVSGNKKLELR